RRRSRPVRRSAWGWVSAGAIVLGACVPPRVLPLRGEPTTIALPAAEVPPGHTRTTFNWHYSDPQLELLGEGQARGAAPDSARFDFLGNQGAGASYALLFGDKISAPTASSRALHHYLPPAPLLWAALGRFAVPPARDTLIRLDGDTLRADIGVVAPKGGGM